VKDIVVYFTGTGKNKKVAEAIRECLECDVIEVKDKLKRNFLRDSFYSLVHASVEIEPKTFDFKDYERVFIVTPIWAFNIPASMRTFLTRNKDAIKDREIVFVSSAAWVEKTGLLLTNSLKLLGKMLALHFLSKRRM
jgi:menaquinone-dependent protoporphyrinogen IX oxidase